MTYFSSDLSFWKHGFKNKKYQHQYVEKCVHGKYLETDHADIWKGVKIYTFIAGINFLDIQLMFSQIILGRKYLKYILYCRDQFLHIKLMFSKIILERKC